MNSLMIVLTTLLPAQGAAGNMQRPSPPAPAPGVLSQECSIDLSRSGQMADVISNGLLSLGKYPESDIAAFLERADETYSSGNELLKAAAKKFGIDEKELTKLVGDFKHCNCNHGVVATSVKANGPGIRATLDASLPVSKFAEDVTLHVVLHEMGHALIREFDLPVLANEETMADAFATFYLTTYMPDRAAEVLEARVSSWMIEASEVARSEWTVRGEHNNDARRAYQVAALAVAADLEKYKGVAVKAGLTENDIRRARDYGTEIHRSWRRILRPLQMPSGMKSSEARVRFADGAGISGQLSKRPIADEINTALRSFDWHSTVTVAFVDGDGGAGWSRSKRTVTVNSQYVARFISQGLKVKK